MWTMILCYAWSSHPFGIWFWWHEQCSAMLVLCHALSCIIAVATVDVAAAAVTIIVMHVLFPSTSLGNPGNSPNIICILSNDNANAVKHIMHDCTNYLSHYCLFTHVKKELPIIIVWLWICCLALIVYEVYVLQQTFVCLCHSICVFACSFLLSFHLQLRERARVLVHLLARLLNYIKLAGSSFDSYLPLENLSGNKILRLNNNNNKPILFCIGRFSLLKIINFAFFGRKSISADKYVIIYSRAGI